METVDPSEPTTPASYTFLLLMNFQPSLTRSVTLGPHSPPPLCKFMAYPSEPPCSTDLWTSLLPLSLSLSSSFSGLTSLDWAWSVMLDLCPAPAQASWEWGTAAPHHLPCPGLAPKPGCSWRQWRCCTPHVLQSREDALGSVRPWEFGLPAPPEGPSILLESQARFSLSPFPHDG